MERGFNRYLDIKFDLNQLQEKPTEGEYIETRFIETACLVEFLPFSQKRIIDCNMMAFFICSKEVHEGEVVNNIYLSATQVYTNLNSYKLYVNAREFNFFQQDKKCALCGIDLLIY